MKNGHWNLLKEREDVKRNGRESEREKKSDRDRVTDAGYSQSTVNRITFITLIMYFNIQPLQYLQYNHSEDIILLENKLLFNNHIQSFLHIWYSVIVL